MCQLISGLRSQYVKLIVEWLHWCLMIACKSVALVERVRIPYVALKIYSKNVLTDRTVAQLVECMAHNHVGEGSNPSGLTLIFNSVVVA